MERHVLQIVQMTAPAHVRMDVWEHVLVHALEIARKNALDVVLDVVPDALENAIVVVAAQAVRNHALGSAMATMHTLNGTLVMAQDHCMKILRIVPMDAIEFAMLAQVAIPKILFRMIRNMAIAAHVMPDALAHVMEHANFGVLSRVSRIPQKQIAKWSRVPQLLRYNIKPKKMLRLAMYIQLVEVIHNGDEFIWPILHVQHAIRLAGMFAKQRVALWLMS